MVRIVIADEFMNKLEEKWKDLFPSDTLTKRTRTFLVNKILKEFYNDNLIFQNNKKKRAIK